MDLSYILNVLGEERGDYYNAVSPPILLTSNFAFATVEDFHAALQAEQSSHIYTRGNNPTTEILRKKIAALEGTEDCLIFSSGVAAISAAIMNTVKSGDHIICVESSYSWTEYLLTQILPGYGINTTFVDGRQLSNFENAIRPETRLIFLESPNTFRFDLQDIKAICDMAKSRGITTAIDNSYCTPLYQQPHLMGVDLVCHTATKYLSGHSDVVAGVVCGTKEKINHLFRNEYMTYGAVLSPHDAWLFLRGLRTLPLRLEKSATNAEALVSHFINHPKIESVIYPFHSSHPQFVLAQKQMLRGCGLFSMVIKTDVKQEVWDFCNRLQRFLLAVSWGGFESLVFPANLKENSPFPNGFVRFYCGLEDADVLIRDIEQALEAV